MISDLRQECLKKSVLCLSIIPVLPTVSQITAVMMKLMDRSW